MKIQRARPSRDTGANCPMKVGGGPSAIEHIEGYSHAALLVSLGWWWCRSIVKRKTKDERLCLRYCCPSRTALKQQAYAFRHRTDILISRALRHKYIG